MIILQKNSGALIFFDGCEGANIHFIQLSTLCSRCNKSKAKLSNDDEKQQ